MKLKNKLAIGSLVAILGAGIYLIKKEEKFDLSNPQKILEEAFKISKPQHISRVKYDPNFEESDSYLREILNGQLDQRGIETYLQKNRKQSEGHYMSVLGISTKIGDGKKRPVFARRELTTTDKVESVEDLANAIHHEDIHAGENRLGYDFGNRRIKGDELTVLFNKGEIRPEAIIAIGEIGAYAAQVERGMRTNVSRIHLAGAKRTLLDGLRIIEGAISNDRLTPMEREYAKATINKYKSVIETLKKNK